MSNSIGLYNRLSSVYDLFDLVFVLGGKGNPRQGIVANLPSHSQCVLDVCVGTGATAVRIAQSKTTAQVTGIDLSDRMLTRATEKIRRVALPNMAVRKMDARWMAFADATFDVVTSSFALHEIEYSARAAILREISRVLRPAGQFYLLDFGMQPNARTNWFLKVWGWLEPAGFREYARLDWHVELRQYGLRVQDIQEYAFSNLVIAQKQ